MNSTSPVTNPLLQLHVHSQSVWLDYIRRDLVTSGELERRVVEDGVSGLTSNPALFEKAIGGSEEYAAAIQQLAMEPNATARSIIERLIIEDIQSAADVLASTHTASEGRDGFVSLEVSPELARDTERSIAEARRLWREVNRPNVMIKIPGTPEGLPAIRTLLSEGINVNITLLFDRSRYEEVAQLYIEALEARAARGEALGNVASVASFFVSRIDSTVDAQIDKRLEAAQGEDRARLLGLRGQIAIANAKLAYQSYQRLFSDARWQALQARGAKPQRVLWASTGTKNPEYRDVLYVEELIGPDTVNTMPPETLAAFRDHGKVRPSLEEGLPRARALLEQLQNAGISLSEVTDGLLVEGVQKFAAPFQKLSQAVERRIAQAKQRG